MLLGELLQESQKIVARHQLKKCVHLLCAHGVAVCRVLPCGDREVTQVGDWEKPMVTFADHWSQSTGLTT